MDHASVYKPFFEEVPEGESSFTIAVPRTYASYTGPNTKEPKKREFYFSEFHLTPGFYSLRAAQLGLDAEEQNAMPIELLFRIAYTIDKDLYKLEGDKEVKFDQGDRAYRLDNLMKEINIYFENKKPESITHSPVFIDWVDKDWYREVRGEEEEEEEEEDVYNFDLQVDPAVLVPKALHKYYEDVPEGISVAKLLFLGALEPSAQKIQGVNNYKFPINAINHPEAMYDMRIRIHIAPLTKILISSPSLLTQLGFSPEQYGTRGELNKLVIANSHPDEYISLIAEGPPLSSTVRGTPTTIIPRFIRNTSQSDWKRVVTDMVTYSKNDQLFPLLKKAFAEISSETNIQVNLQYIQTQERFKIIFPQNPRINAEIRCDTDFGERLGYGPVTKITQSHSSVPVSEKATIIDAETRSRALAFDTDMIIATLNSSSSARTHGLEEPLLGTLLPTDSGTYSMKFQKAQRSVQLPTTGIGGGQYLIPVKINLWAMKKGSEKIPLEWKVSYTVGGVLEGKVPF
jgi:hypothetical protein